MLANPTCTKAIILILVTVIVITEGILLASSQLQACVRDGSQDALQSQMNCQKKFFVTLSIANGQNNTESIQAVLSSATDASGNTVRLQAPIVITVQKSQGTWAYPIDYRQDVNAKPTEQSVYVQNSFVVPTCVDSNTAQSPTCGWYTDPKTGRAVPDSQGFCCACSFAQVIGADTSSTRSNLNCGVFNGQSSGQCMRFGPDWYSVFGVGPVQTVFTMTITVQSLTSAAKIITLSPSQTGGITDDRSVIARLAGDFSAWTSPYDLSSKYLLVPSQPPTSVRLQNALAYSLLVDVGMVTIDGSERNKIGTSFSAFRNEPNACANPVGSSLNNQIDDLIASDTAKQTRGVVGNYLLSNFGIPQLTVDSAGTRRLEFIITQTLSTVLSLEIAADDVVFVQNVSPGRIVSAVANSFESLSKSGKLTVVAQNTGTINADYEIAVVDCTDGIGLVQSQTASIAPGAVSNNIFTLVGDQLLGGGNHACTVQLTDAQQTLLDSVVVSFNTTNTVIDRGAQGGSAPDDSQRQFNQQDSQTMTCSDYCPLIVDIPCFIVKGCWANIGYIVAVVAGLIIFIIIMKKCGCLRRCCCCPCRTCKRIAKKRKEKAKKEKAKQKAKSKRKLLGFDSDSSEAGADSDRKDRRETARTSKKKAQGEVQKETDQHELIPQPKQMSRREFALSLLQRLGEYAVVGDEDSDSASSDYADAAERGDLQSADHRQGTNRQQQRERDARSFGAARYTQPVYSQEDETLPAVAPTEDFLLEELYDIAEGDGWVYCNLQNSDDTFADLLSVYDGEEFSLLGVLRFNVVAEGSYEYDANLPFRFELALETSFQRWRYNRKARKYERMPPQRLAAELFATNLSEEDALSLLSVEPRSGRKCLNERPSRMGYSAR